MEQTRRAFLGSGGAAAHAGLAGCVGGSGLPAKLGLSSPEARASWSTIDRNVAVAGQPTIDDGVPAAWGTIARTPAEEKDLVDWGPDGLNYISGTTPSGLEDFDVEEQFVTVVVGVLPADESLKGDMQFEGNVARTEVTSYQSLQSSGDTAEDNEETPAYHYDYSITLWNRNGVQQPDTLEVVYVPE